MVPDANKVVLAKGVQDVPTGSTVAPHGSSLAGGVGAYAQIWKVPLASLLYSQKRIQTVVPGVSPDLSMYGMAPFPLSSSSHSTRVKVPEQLFGAVVYNAIPPSVIPPVLLSKTMRPPAGTTALNQTSPPL